VGVAVVHPVAPHVLLAGTMSLPPLAGSRTTFAAAVSANGTAVAGRSGSREHAVIWTLGQNRRGYPV
jgi:hypothetical protein